LQNSAETQPQSRHNGNILSFLYFQTVLFLIIAIVLLSLKIIIPNTYNTLCTPLKAMFNEKTTVELVKPQKDTQKTKDKETTEKTKATTVNTDEYIYDYEVGQEDSETAEYVFDLGLVRQMSTAKTTSFKMIMPLKPIRVSSPFGYRVNPVTGNYGIHGGIDLSANSGTAIKAVLPGTVLKSKYSSDYGNFVTVDHGDGLITLYAHCSKLLVKAGDKVDQGDAIALVGSTGRSTGPHLHLEVRINDVRINPGYFLDELNTV